MQRFSLPLLALQQELVSKPHANEVFASAAGPPLNNLNDVLWQPETASEHLARASDTLRIVWTNMHTTCFASFKVLFDTTIATFTPIPFLLGANRHQLRSHGLEPKIRFSDCIRKNLQLRSALWELFLVEPS